LFRIACAAIVGIVTAGGAHAATVANFDGINQGTSSPGLSVVNLSTAGYTGGGVASGNVLSGSDLSATLTFSGVDFDKVSSISFSLGAVVDSGSDFETDDTVSVTAAGTEIAAFEGEDDGLFFNAVSGVSGTFGSTFERFTVDNVSTRGLGSGDLVFTFTTSAPTENLAIDNVDINVVPVPAGLPLLVAGLGALVVVGRRRRG
jgi:hypothetical protein